MSMGPTNNLEGALRSLRYITSAVARHPAFRAPRLYNMLTPNITGLPISGLFKTGLRECVEVKAMSLIWF